MNSTFWSRPGSLPLVALYLLPSVPRTASFQPEKYGIVLRSVWSFTVSNVSVTLTYTAEYWLSAIVTGSMAVMRTSVAIS